MYTFIIALFASICWGIAPAFGKIGLRGVYTMDALAVRTVTTVLLVGFFFFINGGLSRLNTISLNNWFFLSMEAFLATFAGDLAYYAALKWGSIGKTAIVLAASPFVTIIIGKIFFGETLTSIQLLGSFLIVVGIIMVGNSWK